MPDLPRVTVFYEDTAQPQQAAYERVYPLGLGVVLQNALQRRGLNVHLARISEPENGLSAEVLNDTDVLVWWTHLAPQGIAPDVTARVHKKVLGGMGFIALHSSMASNVFMQLLGTTAKVYF